MALENILKTIEEQTSAEILKIKQNAENQTREILSKAQEEAGIIQTGVLEKFREEKIQEAKTILREKQNESYRIVLQKKKKILDDIFAKALKILQTSKRDELISRLKKNLLADSEMIESEQGGFKLIAKDFEVDCSFPSLIAEARQKLETKIANLLF